MMEGTGLLLIGTAIALMLISPVHLTVARWRSALIDVPRHRGRAGMPVQDLHDP
jgi:hypothetical protein